MVIDDGIVHHLGAVAPATVGDILFGITGRHGLDKAQSEGTGVSLKPFVS